MSKRFVKFAKIFAFYFDSMQSETAHNQSWALSSINDSAESIWELSGTGQSKSELFPGQGRVNLSTVRDRAESIWAFYGTGQSQSEQCRGQGRVNLSTVRDRAESIWAFYGTGQSQSEQCPGQGRVNLSTVRAMQGRVNLSTVHESLTHSTNLKHSVIFI